MNTAAPAYRKSAAFFRPDPFADDRPRGGLTALAVTTIVLMHGAVAAGFLWNRPAPAFTVAAEPALMLDLAPLAVADSLSDADDTAQTPAEEAPPPEPEPVPKPEPVPTPEPMPEPIRKIEKLKPRPTPEPVRDRVKPPEETRPQSAAASAPRAASTPTAVNAGLQTWQGRVLAHLEKRKRYPASARTMRQEGTALMKIVIDRQGNVLTSALTRSSGFTSLDQEAHNLVSRAQPLPAPPADVSGTQITLVVPIRFQIR